MATVKFYLRDEKTEKETPITCYVFSNNEKLKYPTGEKIKPEYWNKTTQRVIEEGLKDKVIIKNNKSVNLQLNRFVDAVATIEANLRNGKQSLSIDNFKNGLDLEFKEIQKTQPQPEQKKINSLIEWIENYINKDKITIYVNNNPRLINKRTKGKYQTLLNFLKDFIEFKRKKTLKFEDIDLEFYQDFIYFLQSEKNHSTNTIGKYITTLKVMLNKATEEEINTSFKYKSKKFSSPKEEVDKIYLSQSEIDQIYNLKFTSTQTGLERARDLFLIGCNTALRFSDFTNIQPENIIINDTGKYLKMKTYKTGQKVEIPLNPMAVSILEKYDYKLPKNITNQKMNEHLKEIGEMANIKNIIPITRTRKGIETTINFKKYELITTHTARRTGATNMFKNGIASINIMKITGHKTESAFLGYICIDDEENARIMMQNPFFSGTSETSTLSIAN